MKNLTLILVLSMAAFAGCKKKDGDAGATGSGSASGGGGMASGATTPVAGGTVDCSAAFDHAMSLEKDNMKKEMPSITDDNIAKMKNIAVQHCKDDKWADDVVHCYMDGKTSAEIDGCDKKLAKDQKDKLDKDMEAAMTAMMPKADGSGSAGAPAAGGGDDLPKECGDYKAAMEKLAACDKMPQASKDALKQGFDAMSQGWANAAALPPEAKKAMADGCKQGADALMQSGKALCGW